MHPNQVSPVLRRRTATRKMTRNTEDAVNRLAFKRAGCEKIFLSHVIRDAMHM